MCFLLLLCKYLKLQSLKNPDKENSLSQVIHKKSVYNSLLVTISLWILVMLEDKLSLKTWLFYSDTSLWWFQIDKLSWKSSWPLKVILILSQFLISLLLFIGYQKINYLLKDITISVLEIFFLYYVHVVQLWEKRKNLFLKDKKWKMVQKKCLLWEL